MPQLMPLMWIMSVLMVNFIMMTMVYLFFYVTMNNLDMKSYNEIMINKNYLW